jgi:hypothetical protein
VRTLRGGTAAHVLKGSEESFDFWSKQGLKEGVALGGEVAAVRHEGRGNRTVWGKKVAPKVAKDNGCPAGPRSQEGVDFAHQGQIGAVWLGSGGEDPKVQNLGSGADFLEEGDHSAHPFGHLLGRMAESPDVVDADLKNDQLRVQAIQNAVVQPSEDLLGAVARDAEV